MTALLVIGGFALSTRATAGSMAKAINPIYWINRSVGKNLFDAEDRIWYKGVPEKKEVVLTFDDGPHPESASMLLNVLRDKNVKATFFVVGKMVDLHPEVVRRMIAEGHEVGNHTYDHKRLDTLTREEVVDEITRCNDAVIRATNGRGCVFIRPPGMRYNDIVKQVIREKQGVMIHWVIGAKDYVGSIPEYQANPQMPKMEKPSPDLITERVLKQLKPGAIILLHDNPVTVAAMPKMIDEIRAQGYEIKLCREMMEELPQQVRVLSNPPENLSVR